MAVGPGKYDDFASIVRVQTNAWGVVVIVIGGNHGSGFSVQSYDLEFTKSVPNLLRSMADEMEKDFKENKL